MEIKITTYVDNEKALEEKYVGEYIVANTYEKIQYIDKNEKKIIRRHINANYYDEARLRRLSKEGKILYKRRKETVERSFADSKQNHGYRHAQYRGKAKVQSYAWLSCCVQNMKTIALREV